MTEELTAIDVLTAKAASVTQTADILEQSATEQELAAQQYRVDALALRQLAAACLAAVESLRTPTP